MKAAGETLTGIDKLMRLKFGNNKESLYSFPDMTKDKLFKDSLSIYKIDQDIY
jgi:hypothetical protein